MTEVSPPAPAGPQPTGNPKADAKAAKAYAKASRPWYQKKRWWVVGVILVIAIGGALGGGGDDEATTASDSNSSESNESNAGSDDQNADSGESDGNEADAEKADSGPKPVTVRAAVITKEFEENELAADGKYKDKTLKVTGVVDKIDADLFDGDQYILRIGAGTDFEIVTVNCNGMSTDELSTVNKGDKVTVLGEFEDGGDLGVELDDCKLA